MSNQSPTYSFTAKTRISDIRAYNTLTSPLVIGLLILSIIATALSVIGVLNGADIALSALLISLGIDIGVILIWVFALTWFPHRKPSKTVTELTALSQVSSVNVGHAITFQVVKTLQESLKENTKENFEQAVSLLIQSESSARILSRLQLYEDQSINSIISTTTQSISWDALAKQSLLLAKQLGQEYINSEHVIGAILLNPSLQSYLRQHDVTEADVRFVIWWHIRQRLVHEQKNRWWSEENLLDVNGAGLSWVSGYTNFIDQFSRIPAGNIWDTPYGHGQQVDEAITALARQQQANVVVVGKPGVGRLGVVREIARRIETNQAHKQLNGQRIIYLNLAQIISLGSSPETQAQVIARALNEIEAAGNIIAIIDGIGSALGASGEGRVNLTELIVPFLSSGRVRTITIMSTDEYNKRFKSNQELNRLFEVVSIDPLTRDQTLQVIALTTPDIERRYGIYIPYQTLRTIVDEADSVFPETPFPEKAFDVFEETLSNIEPKGVDKMTPEDVTNVISQNVGFNIGALGAQEKEKLLNLDDLIHKRVINQEAGVAAVSRAMVRARTSVRSEERPIGTFLFLGPTGVGKTETAKALAHAYFNSEDLMQRLDMSEFQGANAVEQLIGGGSRSGGRLTSIVAEHPFSVLLLDEFEKADKSVHQLFLQVFDEGHITGADGNKYSFRHTILIATSNAGAEYIRQHVQSDGKVPEGFDGQLKDHILREKLFAPELLNRFDATVTFTPLTQEHVAQIARLMLTKLNKRLDREHGTTVAITDELVEYLVSIGYNAEFGARPMARAIQNTVEYIVAQRILSNQTQPGSVITLDRSTLEQVAQ